MCLSAPGYPICLFLEFFLEFFWNSFGILFGILLGILLGFFKKNSFEFFFRILGKEKSDLMRGGDGGDGGDKIDH